MVKAKWGALAAEGEEVPRKGPWTVDEDMKLIRYVSSYGERRWDIIAKLAGLRRTGRSCRMRWVNYLRPNVKHGHITPEEESLIIRLHARWGNRWSRIAQRLPGRTDNEIKNYWRTHIKKKAEANHRCCNSLNNNINNHVHCEGSLTSSSSATTMSSDVLKAASDALSTFQVTEDIFDMQCIRRSNSLPEIQIIEEAKEDREFGPQRGICDTLSDPEFYDGGRPSESHDDSFMNPLLYKLCSGEWSMQLSALYEDTMPLDGGEFNTSFFIDCTGDFSNEDDSIRHYYSDVLWNLDDDNHPPP